MNIYYEKDAQPKFLTGKKVAIIGYGSQGHAHASNLKDAGHDVVVGLRQGSPSWTKAAKAGHRVLQTAEAASVGDIVMVLVPDETTPAIYKDQIGPNLRPGKYL